MKTKHMLRGTNIYRIKMVFKKQGNDKGKSRMVATSWERQRSETVEFISQDSAEKQNQQEMYGKRLIIRNSLM